MRVIDISKTAGQLINFIKTTVNRAGFKRVVVAVSGGVDSACAASLAVKALGKENVFILLLPYKDLKLKGEKNSRLLIRYFKIPETSVVRFDIWKAVDELVQPSAISHPPSLKLQWTSQTLDMNEKIRTGNIMARTRMIVLFDQAKRLNALVLGTENKSEHLLGYFTRFGDEASDIEPLRNLYKTEIYLLAKHLDIPEKIISQTPTAGLWQGQTDEGEFSFTYKDADEILYGLYELRLSKQDLIKQGIKTEVIDKVKSWVKKVDFKHRLPHIAPKPVIR